MMRENRLSLGDIARLTFAWMARPLHPYFDGTEAGEDTLSSPYMLSRIPVRTAFMDKRS